MGRSQIAGNSGNTAEVNSDGSLNMQLSGSNVIQPSDIQSHLQSTIQTHNAVSVALSSYSTESSFHDGDGFTDLGITIMNDNTTTSMTVNVLWSNDGTNVHGAEQVTSGAGVSGSTRAGLVSTKARYFKLQIVNGDSALAHTMSAWAYLKA